MTSKHPSRLSPLNLAAFSTPVMVAMALETPWRVFLPAFFSETVGLPLVVVAGILMWIRLFDMVADPAAGWLSDRFPTPIGRRRPWMLASAPLIVLGTWQVFFAQPGISVWTLSAWCVAMHLGYSLLIVPHGGWGLEIADDPHERTRIMGAKVWFAALGAPLVILLPTAMERLGVGGRAEQVHAMGWLLMILAPLSVGLVLWRIPEVAAPRVESDSRSGNPFRQFYEILRNPELARILGLYFLIGAAEACGSGVFIFFVERTLGLGRAAGGLLLIQFLVGLVTVPLWAMISKRLGKRRALLAVLAWQLVTAPLPLLLPSGQAAPLIGYLVLRACAWGADYMLLRAMVADVSAADTARTGQTRASSYYALFNVSLKLAGGLGVGLALWLLARGGFDPKVAATTADTALRIRLVYTLPALVAPALGLLMMITSRPKAALKPLPAT
jgi:Na+/melibiose symporter-like transporter